MPPRTFHTNTEEETIDLGRRLAPELSGVVLLIGNLGAGKTTLTKGIVEGRGVTTASPRGVTATGRSKTTRGVTAAGALTDLCDSCIVMTLGKTKSRDTAMRCCG